MMDDPNSRHDQPEREAEALDRGLPPELVALARRLSTDSAAWQRRLPDASSVAERIRAIPATTPHSRNERGTSMPAPVILPQEHGHGAQTTPVRPPHPRLPRGLLAALAAALIVGLLALLFALQHGVFTTPAGHPTPLLSAPTWTPIAPTATATSAPTVTATTPPTGTWTAIQAYTGSGNYKSASFQVTSPWRVVWQCNRSMGNPGPYPLVVSVSPSGGSGSATQAIDTTCTAGNTSGTSAQETSPSGSVFLSISSAADGEWDVRVQVLR